MALTPTYPGIYIVELPSSSNTITAAPTSVTVFIGYSHPFQTQVFNTPIELFSFTDYERWFGGFFTSLAFQSQSGYFGDLAQSVNQFFLNGGSDAWVIGLQAQPGLIPRPITQATATAGPLLFTAIEIVDAGQAMQVSVSNARLSGTPFSGPVTSPPSDDTADITITFGPPPGSTLPGYGAAETYRSVSLVPFLGPNSTKPNPNYIKTRINKVSSLVTVDITSPISPMVNTATPVSFTPLFTLAANTKIFNQTDFTNAMMTDGLLDKLPIFNLMVIPGVTDGANSSVIATAAAFCERKRAFLIMDPPINDSSDGSDTVNYPVLIESTVEGSTTGELIPPSPNAALYFPYLKSNDPLTGLATNPATGLDYEIPPSGTVAGIFAMTDLNRGVWKAPAGLETTLANVSDVVTRGKMTDSRQGTLNPIGVNCIRNFPGIGPVVFGARTSVTANPAYQQWRYVPVRRMALFLEQSLYLALGWVVFEPNDTPLWTSIRVSIESFMLGLYRQGAFQGSTPSQAFQVKCDDQTTTQTDIDNGVVNIIVAFAPLKPAEFVVIQIAQLAGQSQTS